MLFVVNFPSFVCLREKTCYDQSFASVSVAAREPARKIVILEDFACWTLFFMFLTVVRNNGLLFAHVQSIKSNSSLALKKLIHMRNTYWCERAFSSNGIPLKESSENTCKQITHEVSRASGVLWLIFTRVKTACLKSVTRFIETNNWLVNDVRDPMEPLFICLHN